MAFRKKRFSGRRGSMRPRRKSYGSRRKRVMRKSVQPVRIGYRF